MPPRMRWHEGLPLCVLLVTRFTGFRPTWAPDSPGISYTETGLFVPTQVEVDNKLEFRAYFPWLFPSNIMASFVGRELYGYPKRYANTRIEQDRLLLRVDGQTALDVPYQLRDLVGPRPLRDVARLFSAAGMPYDTLLSRNQSLERDLEWKRHVAWGPREPLRASVRGSMLGPLRLVASLLRGTSPWHPIPMAGWRRSFAPTAQIPEWALSSSGRWSPGAFDVDALVGSSFRVRDLARESLRTIHLDNGGRDLCLSLPGETPRALTALQGMGLRSCFELEMGVDTDVLDFRGLTYDAQERSRLDFGPNARRRYGE
ncbi:MAG: acetoacetate decarboxylase family protein [Proteobacteria bacterium]|nr:acetoacetate decarboxylase family protein [Pseudomonadota bacterium]MCP4921205.1 acetoacetate decarboxylase family protein [Pseudomonadota bacterium]